MICMCLDLAYLERCELDPMNHGCQGVATTPELPNQAPVLVPMCRDPIDLNQTAIKNSIRLRQRSFICQIQRNMSCRVVKLVISPMTAERVSAFVNTRYYNNLRHRGRALVADLSVEERYPILHPRRRSARDDMRLSGSDFRAGPKSRIPPWNPAQFGGTSRLTSAPPQSTQRGETLKQLTCSLSGPASASTGMTF